MADQQLNYHRVGNGSPLILVHGIGATWQCWKPIIPALATAHDVIVPDLPGFGGSVALGIERPSLEHFAQSILNLADGLGIDRFHVAGNSLGGAVALELLKSGRVLSYTGISPAGQTHGKYIAFTKVVLRGSYYGSRALRPIAPALLKVRPVRALLLGQMVGRPQNLTADYSLDLLEGMALGSGFEATLAHAIPGDRGLDIPPYDGPAQMLWGTRDMVLPLSAAARYGEKWPGLEVIPMKGLGHVPMQDDPKLIADLMLEFTAKADAARSAAAPATA